MSDGSQPDAGASVDKLVDAKLAAYKDEYATHVRIWADLERKAQAMTAIAGTFVAAANALAASQDFKGLGFGPVMAMLGLLLLGGSALRSIQALRVRTVLMTSASEVVRAVDAGISAKADYPTIVNTYLDPWPSVLTNVESANKEKADHLRDAEALLACAVVVFTLLGVARFAVQMAQ